jgi:hypothetical protein
MTTSKRRFELDILRKRYSQATKCDKIRILGEFCANYRYNRKYAIKLLKMEPDINKSIACKKRGPKPKYQPDKIVPILKEIWFASDQVCSKKLEALIPYWLSHYEALYGPIEPDTRSKLLTISSPTIDRILATTKFQFKTKGKCGTKPGTLLKRQIPIHNNYWNEGEPGFLEADTVAHCGDSIAGNFVWSLTMTDIYSGWTELRATWCKGEAGVIERIQCIEKHLPFKLKGFDSDNGSEFLNHHLLRYFTDRKEKVTFTRSRPYRKNDNAHVEQKNWSCVRQLLGYDRIEDIKAVDIMNDIYINEWSLLNNFFMPTMKLEKKSRDGSKIKKIHSKPVTPYMRLLASKHLNELQKQLLTNKYNTLNPFELRKSIESKLNKLFQLIRIRTDIKKRGNI